MSTAAAADVEGVEGDDDGMALPTIALTALAANKAASSAHAAADDTRSPIPAKKPPLGAGEALLQAVAAVAAVADAASDLDPLP